MKSDRLSRRTFLLASGAISFLPMVSKAVEYVSTSKSIEVFVTRSGRRFRTQSVPSHCPVSLTVDPSGKRLFAINEVSEYEGLPRGSVECYSIEPCTRQLQLISRQPLALSATMPRQLAISPDGETLIVAVYGGGAYNLLPAGRNGELGQVTQIVKEIGCGSHPDLQSSAHPHSVVFHPTGKFVFGTDFGSDRINVFAFKYGRMMCLQRRNVPPGSGPGHLWLSEDGSSLVVQHELGGQLARYRFDINTGLLS